MPFPWTLSLDPLLGFSQQHTARIDEHLTVRANHINWKRESRRAEFDDAVVAEYGVTKVRADRLTVFFSEPGSPKGLVNMAIAEGHVAFVDPDGTIQAERLSFDWVTGEGSAASAQVEIAGIELKAESIDIKPDGWLLKNVEARLCEGGDIQVRLASMRLVPGDRAILRQLRLNLFGARFGAFPKYSIRIGQAEDFISTPRISSSPETGFRLRWKLAYAINPVTLATSAFGVFERRQPYYAAQITHSFLSAKSPVATPRSESGSPLPFNFLHSVTVESPEDGRKEAARKRFSITLGTVWNVGEFIEGEGHVDRSIETVLEGSGSVFGAGAIGQLRYEKLRSGDDPYENRVMTAMSILSPSWKLGGSGELFARLDGRGHWNAGTGYHGWVRGEAGAIWSISPSFRLAASYGEGSSRGVRKFNFDEPKSMRSVQVRSDVQFGPTTVKVLAKYGFGGVGWHGEELYVSQIAGCLEPYFLYRGEDRGFSIGVKFRPLKELREIGDRLSNRAPGNRIIEPD